MNNEIGSKTKNLQILKELGLNVPKLDFIPANFLHENTNTQGVINEQKLQTISKQLHQKLNCSAYAVRSSALIEDTESESYAGQFQTKIAVKPQDLPDAIQKITSHAHKYLKGDISKFSIIVQGYIDADFSGITFTRNPAGSREMVIEYHQGIGEEIVSGKVKPAVLKLFHTTSPPTSTLPNINEAIKTFKQIEKHFLFPQDIEWAIKDKKWYYLQSRPITTISNEEYSSYQYLDKKLPKKPFYFEKTELSEIAPRPTVFTQDLIEQLYAKNGPIHQVYKKHGLTYKPSPSRTIIGNELYTDMEKELKTLLPAYSYLGANPPAPKISSLLGLFTSFKNGYRLSRIKTSNHIELFKNLKEAIDQNINSYNFKQLLIKFKEDYQIIFEINLLTGLAIKKLQSVTKDQIPLPTLLSHGFALKLELPNLQLNSEKLSNLTGNTIEVADQTPFIKNDFSTTPDIFLSNWWDNLSNVKKQILEVKIKDALILNRLREYTRWLTVIRINQLRKHLHKRAEKAGLKDPKLIYFTKIEELCSPSEEKATKRLQNHQKYSKYTFPKTLYFKPICTSQSTQGISPGQAEGVVIKEATLKTSETNKNYILMTKVLSPSLVQHFPKIKGIISEQGGMLSHLAIMAREKSLPVITNINFNQYKEGQRLQIDGASGQIEVL